MKNVRFSSILASLLFFYPSCNKSPKMVNCSYNVVYLGAQLALEGYDTSVLENIVYTVINKETQAIVKSISFRVETYEQDGNLLMLKTNESDGGGGPIKSGFDYVVTIATDTFTIKI